MRLLGMKRKLSMLLASVAAASLIASPGYAAHSSGSGPHKVKFTVSATHTKAGISARDAVIACVAKQDAPHYSTNTGGVIAKVRVTCTGSAGSVVVSVSGTLGSVGGGKCSPNTLAAGPRVPRWSGHSDTKSVVSNSGPSTFYLPPVGGPKFKFNASWYATSTVLVNGNQYATLHNERYTGPDCP